MLPSHKSLYIELEETFLKIISTLPMSDARELLQQCLSFSTRNVEDCPHLVTAFNTWFRRATQTLWAGQLLLAAGCIFEPYSLYIGTDVFIGKYALPLYTECQCWLYFAFSVLLQAEKIMFSLLMSKWETLYEEKRNEAAKEGCVLTVLMASLHVAFHFPSCYFLALTKMQKSSKLAWSHT